MTHIVQQLEKELAAHRERTASILEGFGDMVKTLSKTAELMNEPEITADQVKDWAYGTAEAIRNGH